MLASVHIWYRRRSGTSVDHGAPRRQIPQHTQAPRHGYSQSLLPRQPLGDSQCLAVGSGLYHFVRFFLNLRSFAIPIDREHVGHFVSERDVTARLHVAPVLNVALLALAWQLASIPDTLFLMYVDDVSLVHAFGFGPPARWSSGHLERDLSLVYAHRLDSF